MGGETDENTSAQALSDTDDCPLAYGSRHTCSGSFADVHCDPYDESDCTGKRSTSCQSDNAISHREAWWQSKANTCLNPVNPVHRQPGSAPSLPRATKRGWCFCAARARYPEWHRCGGTARGWWTLAAAAMAAACEDGEGTSQWCCFLAACAHHEPAWQHEQPWRPEAAIPHD